MRLQTGWIDVPMGGKTCASYRARPAAPEGPLPAVLLVQEQPVQAVGRRPAGAKPLL